MNAYPKIKLYIILISAFLFFIINIFAKETNGWINVKLAKNKGTLSRKLIIESTINSKEKINSVLIRAEITSPDGKKYVMPIEKVYDNIYAASFDNTNIVGEYYIKISAEAILEKTREKLFYDDEFTYKVEKKLTEQMAELTFFNFEKNTGEKVAKAVVSDKDEQTTLVLPQVSQIKEGKSVKKPVDNKWTSYSLSFISFLLFNLIALYTLYFIYKNREKLLPPDIEERLLYTYKNTIKTQNKKKGAVL